MGGHALAVLFYIFFMLFFLDSDTMSYLMISLEGKKRWYSGK